MCVWQACVHAARANSRVIQQQDNRVEFFPGSVIGSERHYEVIETVPCCFGRNDYELVFKPVRFGILEAVVPAPLQRQKKTQKHGGILGLLL